MNDERDSRPAVLVTGSSGLIGSRVAKELARDHVIVGLDRDPPKESDGVLFVQCDLTSDDDTARALGIVREHHRALASVIHLAAYYDFSGKPSPLYRELTVEGTRRLLRLLGTFDRVEQFVFTSTLLVMEPADDELDIITETSVIEDEPWSYPRSKIEAEQVIRTEHGAIPAVVLRIAGAYDETGHSIPIGHHIARIYEKQLESYFFPGDPDHGVPYVHLDDLIACIRAVVEHRSRLDPYEVFLVAEPELVTHDELQDRLGELIHGKEWPTIRIPKVAAKAGAWVREKLAGEEETFIKPWMVDIADDHYPIAIERARARLGWEPRHRLRDSLEPMVASLRADPRGFYERNGLPLPDDLEQANDRDTEEAP